MSNTTHATILVVDDEPEVRKLVCAMASQLGYNALAAGSGLHALATHQLFRPIDLLITDVVMEGMSGPALAERLTNLQPGLKVLYISGYGHSRVVRKYVVEAGHALLAKPFGARELEARLREMLAPAAMSAAR
jgi:two-component system cell cycle sensor histidine kinase/response regulator CckA